MTQQHSTYQRLSFFRTPTVSRFLILCAVSAFFMLTSCGASRNAAETTETVDPYANFYVDFMHTDRLSVAIERAKLENKMVFLDFYTSWCLPCKIMDEDVFTDPEFGDYMNENFVSVKIDAEKGNGPNLAALYGVRAFPTLLFLDVDGNVKSKKEGAAYQTELRALGAKAKASL